MGAYLSGRLLYIYIIILLSFGQQTDKQLSKFEILTLAPDFFNSENFNRYCLYKIINGTIFMEYCSVSRLLQYKVTVRRGLQLNADN